MRDGVKEIDDTICNFPSCDKPKWDPNDFCGNTHDMMTGVKDINESHREKVIKQKHTWDNMTKTCTPIIYSQTLTESDDEVQIGDDEVGEKGTSDDDPDDST